MSAKIYIGFWTNWSRGKILGATLTLDEQNSGLLTAFIATFVTIVGVQLWKVLSYLIHQFNSRSSAQDGLHHQKKIIFRNSPTPGSAAWTFLQQAWAWRGKAKSPLMRTLPWAMFGITYIVLFALLAVFSSQISAVPGTARLVIGEACGAWYLTDLVNDPTTVNFKQSNDSLTALTYARSCYNQEDSLFCSRFTKSSIAVTSRTDVPCPWPSMCLEGEASAFQIESELIDSHEHLGMNAPHDHRVAIQLRTTCAPIISDGYATIVNGTDAAQFSNFANDEILRFWYGPVNDKNAETVTNWTFIYSTPSYRGHLLDAYPRQIHASDPNGAIGWQPVPELASVDADVALVFVATNNVEFSEPVDDPIFAAHYKDLDSNSNTYEYKPDNWVTVLACAEQYRFCIPSPHEEPKCTNYLGEFQVYSAFDNLNASEVQTRTADRIWDTLGMTIYDFVRARNSQALQASDTIVNYLSPGLPANQWMLEVQGWFQVNLAYIQRSVVEWATGPSDPALANAIREMRTNDTFESQMCMSQMIRQTEGTTSFSVLGLAILLIVGGIIILLSFVIELIVGWLQKWSGRGEVARLAWISDDKLQLHRLLNNELGLGDWEEGEQSVPTTRTRLEDSDQMVDGTRRRKMYLSLAATVVMDSRQDDGRVADADYVDRYERGAEGSRF